MTLSGMINKISQYYRMRWMKRILPRGLFGRTLLIIVTPTLLALCVATFVFFDRHWYTTSNRLTHAVAGDIAMVVELMRKNQKQEKMADIVQLADEKMDMYVSFSPSIKLAPKKKNYIGALGALLKRALSERVGYPYSIHMREGDTDMIAVQVETPEGLHTILFPERRIYTPTTGIFIGWMVGSSILLSVIALLFMRNQIRPVRRLAEAAEAIGRGQDAPNFKPEGATEVRQAAVALLIMRDRLRRQITQRTAMLAGVSHDLRTPLTRMKLQLALMPESEETREIAEDISEMESMVEAYLAFAKGEEAEPASEIELVGLLEEVVASARRQNKNVSFSPFGEIHISLRRNAMKRCVGNLLGNALRYANKAQLSVFSRGNAVDIIIDDDGPGIPPERREEVFRPFMRLDESRNPVTGGVGLGLTIARDIARFHGGDVALEDSPLGGLRARIWLPV